MTHGIAPKRIPILMIILVSYLMIILDISIVITALPKIQDSLGFSEVGLSWVQNAYTLTFGGLLLLGARGGDLLGRRRLFIIGLAIFAFASLLIGFTQSAAWMIASRALQGIGAALLAPSTLALLTVNFPEGEERTRAVAYYGATAGIGSSVGLVAGGIIADLISWRAGFFINLPIAAILIAASLRYIDETEPHSGDFDLIGALSSTLGMTSLVYAIVHSEAHGWTNPSTLFPLAVGLLILAFFVLNEWRAKQPIMPLHLFANAERSCAYAARVLMLGAVFSFFFYITQYLQIVKGFRPLEAGFAFLPLTILQFLGAMAVPRLTRHYGNGPLLAGGLLILMTGMIWVSSQMSVSTSYLTGVALPMLLIGTGLGLALSPLTASSIIGVKHQDAGAASGLVNVAHQLGGSFGFAVLVAVFAAANSTTLTGGTLFTHRIASTFAVGSELLVATFGLVMVFIVRPFNRKSAAEKPVANRLDHLETEDA